MRHFWPPWSSSFSSFALFVQRYINSYTTQCTCHFQAPHFTLVKEALIEIGCVVTSLVVGWLSRACNVAKRCILGL